MAQCVDCKHFNNSEINDEYCGQCVWDRSEDEFIKSQNDYEEYINKDRICSEFESV